MRHQHRVLCFSIAFALLSLSIPKLGGRSWPLDNPLLAPQKENCKKCKYAKCIENLIAQKESLKEGYETLAKNWEQKWVDASGKPRLTVDLQKDYPGQNLVSIISSQMELL